ncbi:hypothetical protein [Enterococcus sp. LJL90]
MRAINIIDRFTEKEIQLVIEDIQTAAKTPDFMKVVAPESYELQADGTIRGEESGEALYTAQAPLDDHDALLHELAEAMIDLSL